MPTLYAKRKRYLSLEHFAITKGIGNREMAMFIGEGKGKKEKLFDETFVTVPLPDFPIMFFHESLKTSLEKGGKIHSPTFELTDPNLSHTYLSIFIANVEKSRLHDLSKQTDELLWVSFILFFEHGH